MEKKIKKWKNTIMIKLKNHSWKSDTQDEQTEKTDGRKI